MTRRRWVGLAFAVAFVAMATAIGPVVAASQAEADLQWFVDAAQRDGDRADAALDRIAAVWRDGYAAMFVDMARLMRPSPRPADSTRESLPAVGGVRGRGLGQPAFGVSIPLGQDPSTIVRRRLLRFLEARTGQAFGDDLGDWRAWIWSQPYAPHPHYPAFKAAVLAQIDPAFRRFFPVGVDAAIRLDEVDWGGVGVNGIPPLEAPRTIPAGEAGYLRDGHIVFGVSIDGEARAYPKRILAWHELALDRVGGVDLTLVYCTLCGTVIPYESEVGGVVRRFGTSGLLYRSNKLLFDHESGSLWSSLEGRPVVGALTNSGLALRYRSVVTTTWGEWKARHPETTVLARETGFDRDYAEGAAYRDYFATDRLMFAVPETDDRLKNKDEVLVLRSSGAGVRPLAIAVDHLARRPIYRVRHGDRWLVLVSSPDGAVRVYAAGDHRFARRVDDDAVIDDGGQAWRVTEDALIADEAGARLPRVAAHRAFWFAWYAQFPETDLIYE